MRQLLLGFLFLVAVSANVPNGYFDNLVDVAPEEVLPKLVTSNSAFGLCPSETYIDYYNEKWETSLGLDSSLTWRNASILWEKVRTMINEGNIGNFQKLCHSRDRFYYNMGQILYYQCVNLFSLLQWTDDIREAAAYVRMWQHLDFMCNVGFEQLLIPGDLKCVETASTNLTCVHEFEHNTNWSNVCPLVDTFMNCQKNLIDTACGVPNGYYACEGIRLGYGSYCTNLRCNVQ
uniref:Secreted protein n=1 Tax=Panagrellus redivivus TaxID=6233 RepID=A0A7E4VMC9_PANRE